MLPSKLDSLPTEFSVFGQKLLPDVFARYGPRNQFKLGGSRGRDGNCCKCLAAPSNDFVIIIVALAVVVVAFLTQQFSSFFVLPLFPDAAHQRAGDWAKHTDVSHNDAQSRVGGQLEATKENRLGY